MHDDLDQLDDYIRRVDDILFSIDNADDRVIIHAAVARLRFALVADWNRCFAD